MDKKLNVIAERSELMLRSLRRHRLVFVQMGAAFDPLRDDICAGLAGQAVSIDQRRQWHEIADSTSQALVVTDLERCSDTNLNVLGEVREIALSLLDAGKMICLVSRAPRVSFASVPGSSVLEDSALVTLPLLRRADLGLDPSERPVPGWQWPSVTYGTPLDLTSFIKVLHELGQGLTAAIDHAIFEVDPKGAEGLKFLSARELEGLRGSGLIEIDDQGNATLALRSSGKSLREALATHVSEAVTPAGILPEVTSGLWFIERKIRSTLRKAAISKYPADWRTASVGGLKSEILKRAQQDTNVTAKSVEDLRDPLEWLTLGELMDVVRGTKFDNLGVEPAIWKKLQEQLVPVRNRLAHVRMLKSQDAETVSMWAGLIRTRFGS